MTHPLQAAITQLEWLVRSDMEERHCVQYVTAAGPSGILWLKPWERTEDRQRIRDYVAALRILCRERDKPGVPVTLGELREAVGAMVGEECGIRTNWSGHFQLELVVDDSEHSYGATIEQRVCSVYPKPATIAAAWDAVCALVEGGG
jgi:hypothetical protein